ncbi:MAG: HD family phosphohydrolase [bacterium]
MSVNLAIIKKLNHIIRKKKKVFAKSKFWKYAPHAFLGVIIIVISTLIFPYEPSIQFANLKEGEIYVGDEVIAPFTFLVNKSEEEYNQDKKNAAEKVNLVFVRSDSIEKKCFSDLDQFFKQIEKVRESSTSDSIKVRNLQSILNDYAIIVEQKNLPILLSGNTGSKAKKPSKARNKDFPGVNSKQASFDYKFFKTNIERILKDMYSFGILNVHREEIPDYVTKISVNSFDTEILEDVDNHFNLDNVELKYLDKLRRTFPKQQDMVKIGYEIIGAFLKPNLIYDQVETEERIREAESKVPLAKGTVLAKERIIDTHERISGEALEKLRSLSQAISEREKQNGGIKLILPFVARILLIVLAVSFTVLFLFTSRRDIFDNVKKLSLIFIVFVLILFTTYLVNKLSLSAYLIPIAIASMLLTIFFDTRTAFIGTVSLSILIGALKGNDFGVMIVSLFVGTISTFSVREIQARSWIFKGFLAICGAYVFSIGTVEFVKHTTFMNILPYWYDGIINGFLSPILAYGLMIIIEYVFRIPTDSTLLELSDLNKPLLRQLAIRAPGTYHHSLLVGNLAEAAAEAINANALLTRVGAYYHDIGKMEKPEYFVENQKGGRNPHEKLTPNMSCLILINHVKRGLEIAEQNSLPQEIVDFIPRHHGTNLIRFFYEKALSENQGTEINEADFRYPGPKPDTKETGIVMLADAVEAASRTLKDPTVSRIRGMINNICQERLADSELDECPLTLRDMNEVKKSFLNILTGIFHGRITYPDQNSRFFKKGDKPVREKSVEPAN